MKITSVLIDTDVILDFFFDRKPYSDDAATILSKCEKGLLQGFVTPVIISNVYYLLAQSGKQEKVIEKLISLLSIIDVVSMDKNIIMVALNSDFKGFEDALQNYSAEFQGQIKVILTRNTKDYKKSKLSFMKPDEFLKSL